MWYLKALFAMLLIGQAVSTTPAPVPAPQVPAPAPVIDTTSSISESTTEPLVATTEPILSTTEPLGTDATEGPAATEPLATDAPTEATTDAPTETPEDVTDGPTELPTVEAPAPAVVPGPVPSPHDEADEEESMEGEDTGEEAAGIRAWCEDYEALCSEEIVACKNTDVSTYCETAYDTLDDDDLRPTYPDCDFDSAPDAWACWEALFVADATITDADTDFVLFEDVVDCVYCCDECAEEDPSSTDGPTSAPADESEPTPTDAAESKGAVVSTNIVGLALSIFVSMKILLR